MKMRLPAVLPVALVAFLASGTAVAEKTYTPSQLRTMVNSGSPPKQGAVSRNENKRMNFGQCVITVQQMAESVKPNYPVRTLVDTKLIYTVKLWTNDAAMTLSCSSLDEKLIITESKYL